MKDTTSEEIRVRLTTTRNTTSVCVNIWKNDDMSRNVKKRFLSSLVSSGAQCGSETCTLRKEIENCVSVFEMWVWRRMLRISGTQRKTNIRVRDKVGLRTKKVCCASLREECRLSEVIGKEDQIISIEGELPGQTDEVEEQWAGLTI